MTDTATPEEIRCTLCGWVIEDPDLATMTGTGVVHFDRQCPKGDEPKKAKPARKATSTAPVVKEMKIVGVRGAHAECDHEATKSARAACRRKRQA